MNGKFPERKTQCSGILYSDVCIGELNTRMEEEKLLVEGRANVFVIYLGEGENPSINYFENTLPIEGILTATAAMRTWSNR